ncbi:MAG: hypothetical protein IID59_01765 [Proteobacteria bacterium]|nr:hypothetical protein [Pseudomonadota bacterium]
MFKDPRYYQIAVLSSLVASVAYVIQFVFWYRHKTGDRQNFQGRYVVRHAFEGESTCDMSTYQAQLLERQEREAQQLANLTGWDIDDIRRKISLIAYTKPEQKSPWWSSLWN